MPLPLVSIVIPCYREAGHIGACLRSILDNGYPVDRLDILVLDGMSTDGTREAVTELARRHPCIRLVDNPGGNKARALNTGIAMARGELVARMDAHADYAPGYIAAGADWLARDAADNVGGVRINTNRTDTLWARSFALAFGSPLGVGDASYNIGVSKPTATDVVYLFFMRRTKLLEVGPFDERLVRGQDREFNLRLSRLGARMFVIPDMSCRYFIRSEWRTFVPWMYESGSVPPFISRLTGTSLYSWRNFVPSAFALYLLVLVACWLLLPAWPWALVASAPALVYLLLALAVALRAARREGRPALLLTLPLVFPALHIAYGLGFVAGLLRRAPAK